MKMNQAEVAFVAFDAQDVIAASGDGYYFARDNIKASLNNNQLFCHVGHDDIRNSNVWVLYRAADQSSPYYILSSAEYQPTGGGDDDYIVYLVSSETEPSGKPLTGCEDSGVFDWLKENNYLISQ